MRKPAAMPRLFLVPSPFPKKPKSPKPAVQPLPEKYVQGRFDLEAYLDLEGSEDA